MTRPDFIRSRLSEAEVNELRERAEAAESALAAAQKRIAVLEAALRWYAEEWRYSYDNDCCFDGINPERYKNGGKSRNPDSSENGVSGDNGDRARAARK